MEEKKELTFTEYVKRLKMVFLITSIMAILTFFAWVVTSRVLPVEYEFIYMSLEMISLFFTIIAVLIFCVAGGDFCDD